MTSDRLAWIDLVHVPLIVVDKQGVRVLRGNARAGALFGQVQLEGTLTALIGAYAADRLRPLLSDESQDSSELLLYCRTPAGLATLGFRAAPVHQDDLCVLTLRDHSVRGTIRSRESSGVSIADFGAMLEDIVRSLPVGVEIYDGNFRELFCNTLSNEMFGSEYNGKVPHHDDWWEYTFPDDAERARAIAQWRERLEVARADPTMVQKVEWDVRCRDGQQRTVQFRFRFIGSTYIVVFWDVTERRRLEEELRHLAGTDELTGLHNRRRFFEEAERAFSAALATATHLSVLMLDIDHFKSINDRYGHVTGDRVLREVAQRCVRALRSGDMAARVGGEEFAVLLPSTDTSGALKVAEKLLVSIAGAPVAVDGTALEVQASIGGTFRLTDDRTVAALVERADRALYAAKGSGRNRVVVLPAPSTGWSSATRRRPKRERRARHPPPGARRGGLGRGLGGAGRLEPRPSRRRRVPRPGPGGLSRPVRGGHPRRHDLRGAL